MQLKPFLLDAWLDQYEHSIEFNLAASTGPTWTVKEILDLADEETRHRFLSHKLVYSRPAGADSLRAGNCGDAECAGGGCPDRDRGIRGTGRADVAGGGARRKCNYSAARFHYVLSVAGIVG